MTDSFDLERFVLAQERDGSYEKALAELRRGSKVTHWIWWVFPQLAGLGVSDTSRRYAISSLDEARAYLAHPVLGPRLREATLAVLAHADHGAREILGGDDVKFRSSMTLFEMADPGETAFSRALELFFDGQRDSRTEQSLR